MVYYLACACEALLMRREHRTAWKGEIMKVIAFNGSPRKDGNTNILISRLLQELEREGIGIELVQVSEKKIRGCIACFKCHENQNGRCAVEGDAANEYIEKIINAQGIVLGSPVYFQDVTSEMKALIDRAGFVGLANGKMYRNKIGASIACFRRSGGMHTVDAMNHFFLSNEVIIAGRALGVAKERGDVEKDEEAMQTARTLGQRMAWLLKRVAH
jgi:multimeric flavodoxin WrbA